MEKQEKNVEKNAELRYNDNDFSITLSPSGKAVGSDPTISLVRIQSG